MNTDIKPSLHHLAEQINEEHNAATSAARKTMDHACRAGELLIQAKQKTKHGEWLLWLADNFDFTPRTAQGYMRVAAHWLELQAKSETVSHLGLREALALLAPAKDLVPHEICLCFPAMTEAEFEGLKDSLRRFGYISEIGAVTLFEGQILDGKERYRACADVGVEPEFETFTGDYDQAIQLCMSRNLYRQHFTPLQCVALEGQLRAA